MKTSSDIAVEQKGQLRGGDSRSGKMYAKVQVNLDLQRCQGKAKEILNTRRRLGVLVRQSAESGGGGKKGRKPVRDPHCLSIVPENLGALISGIRTPTSPVLRKTRQAKKLSSSNANSEKKRSHQEDSFNKPRGT